MISPFTGMSCVTKQKNDITFCGDVVRHKAEKCYHLLWGCRASQSRKMLSPFTGMSCVTKQKNDITFCGDVVRYKAEK